MVGGQANGGTTGWVYDPAFLRHHLQESAGGAGARHPECPDRLRAIVDRLERERILEGLERVHCTPALDEELERVHPHRHIDSIRQSRGRYLDPDTFVGDESPEIACLAAGSVLAAARAVYRGELVNVFCAVRPPGHHASAERAMGFCLYNNVAVAAAAIISENPGARVFIMDWDVHHGNGTQAVFYESPSVLYGSVHQYPSYPGTGAIDETGRGAGKGTTVNRPLAAGSGDTEFLGGIDDILENHALRFAPDIVLISAGFDAHQRDPLGGLEVSTDAFAEATRRVCAFARSSCGGRVVSVLEGGYNLEALAESVLGHVTGLRAEARAPVERTPS